MIDRAHEFVERVFALPGILDWRKRRFDHAFADGYYGGVCRGIYASYEEAAAAAPKTLPLGYDNDGPARMYQDRLVRVFPSDYPMMFWLQKAFEEGARQVFDLGGHVGISYYAYQKHLPYPSDLSWRVCDVPAVVRSGLELARTRDEQHRLSFTEHFEEADNADVLFTSGCVQYLPETLGQRIASLRQRPRWVLVNLLPLHDQRAFWTVQSIGQAFCPYRIQRAETFFGELTKLDYVVVDKWENLEKECDVAFERGFCLDRYFGAAMRLT